MAVSTSRATARRLPHPDGAWVASLMPMVAVRAARSATDGLDAQGQGRRQLLVELDGRRTVREGVEQVLESFLL